MTEVADTAQPAAELNLFADVAVAQLAAIMSS